MKSFKKIFTVVFLTAFVLSSCGKYEDGPMFSLLPKTMRLQKQWRLDKRFINGVEQTLTTDDKDDYFELKKDGVLEVTNVSGSFSTTTTGKWELTSSKEILVFTYSFGGYDFNIEYTILRLTSKELWLKYTNSSSEEEENHYVLR